MPNTPHLRLFLSADLAGSTSFKQSRKSAEWQRFFTQFYRQLPAYLQEKKQGRAGCDKLNLWKTVGDEIVFSTPLASAAMVPHCVAAFRQAVAAYRRETIESTKGLDIKCAGWTAGFPVGNLEVTLPTPGSAQLDYIGPGMDIGFRLVKHASPRKMLLAVELAYLLTIPQLGQGPAIFMDAGMFLKGVARDQTYPCLWLDNFLDDRHHGGREEIELAEEKVRETVRKSCLAPGLHKYCARWLRDMGEPFLIPFIDGDPHVGTRPENFARLLADVSASTQGAEELAGRTPVMKGAKVGKESILGALDERLASKLPAPE